MKYKVIVLLTAVLFAFCGCADTNNVDIKIDETTIEESVVIDYVTLNDDEPKNINGVTVETVNYEDKENDVVYTTSMAEKIVLSKDFLSSHKELKKVIESYNERAEKEAKKFVLDNKETIREMIKDRDDDTLQLSYQDTVMFNRLDEKIFSFIKYVYQYTGGAHGYGGTFGKSYDVNTGKEIVSDDVFTDKAKLKDVLLERIDKEYSGALFDEWKDTIEEHFAEDKPFNIIIYDDKLEVIFDPYYLGPWSSGDIIVSLEYNQYKDIIDKKYFE